MNKSIAKAVTVFVLVLSLPILAAAQRQVAVQEAVIDLAVPAAVAPTQDDLEEEDGLEGEGRYLGGAPLKTDPDLMARLEKADQLLNDGNYRVAARLWQSVLEQSGDTLYTNDGETYFALTEKVESILAQLPEAGLRAYRISADGNAKELMAQANGENDLDVLSQIVELYFVSSLGDEAAFRLGSIYLDRYDFVGAARLLGKIVNNYPDPSVPMDEVWLRLAIAYSYMGNSEGAREALAKSRELQSSDSELSQAVSQLVSTAPNLEESSKLIGNWNTRLGDASRMGVMPALPEEAMSEYLVPIWHYYYEPRAKYKERQYEGTVKVGEAAIGDSIKKSVSSSESDLIKSWKDGSWRPAGQLILTEDAVAYKTGADIAVWDFDAEKVSPDVRWRPLWLNVFALDEATRVWKNMYEAYGRYDRSSDKKTKPYDIDEVQQFGDQIAQAMSIYQGVLYNIEGENYDIDDSSVPKIKTNPNFSWGTVPRRTRTNHLTAYDMHTGKLLWRVPQVENQTDENQAPPDEIDPEATNDFDDIGFMAAPIGFGDIIIAPVNVGGSIFLYAMHPQKQGELVWKSYLCDEPSGGSQPWSPIHVSIEGSSLYVTCGAGVVFSVDPMTGGIRYARRYERTGTQNNLFQRFGNDSQLLELDGWAEDLVIPYGNLLLVFSSDYNVVWAIDRQTAEFQWKTENEPFGQKFDYVIGVHDDYIYLGGPQTIAAVSIRAQGRLEWVQSFEGERSYGQAMLTTNGVYVPVGNTIVRYAHKSDNGAGKVLATSNVDFGTGAPVGNLYSDGHRIWVLGANRLFALGPAPERLETEETTDDVDADATGDAEATDEKKDDDSEGDDGNTEQELELFSFFIGINR